MYPEILSLHGRIEIENNKQQCNGDVVTLKNSSRT